MLRVGVGIVAVFGVVVAGAVWSTSAAREAEQHPEPDPPSIESSATEVRPASLSVSSEDAPAEEACPADMVLVEGRYCPDVKHECLRYMDPPGRYHHFRCAEYGPASCEAPRKRLRYCIDRDEYSTRPDGLPENKQSWSDAALACQAQGKRVCLESEWNFACEGEEMRPYPYGFKRADVCNADRQNLMNKQGKLRDLRATPSETLECVSPFGVRNLAGNLEEFVTIDGSSPERPAMKGAWWQPGRHHCRARQTAHDGRYKGVETGFRCCAQAAPDSEAL